MNYCPRCGEKIDDHGYACSKCGYKLNNYDEDSGHIGWGILGYFIPLAGLIIYLALFDSKPRTAKMAGKGALISVIVHAVLIILFFTLFIYFIGYLRG